MVRSTYVERRPVAVRRTPLARRTAAWLAASSVTPNQISLFGLFAGAFAAGAILVSPEAGGAAKGAAVLAAITLIGVRAACNVLDGLVAVEGGKQTPSGVVYNELPDRLADCLMLVSAGYAAGAAELGWAAALFAVLVPYVRGLGAAAGAGQDFSGPMAKQERMLVIVAALAGTLVAQEALMVGLAVVIAGSAWTLVSRTRRLLRRLEAGR